LFSRWSQEASYEIATFVGNKNFIMDDVVYEKKSDWVLMNMMAAVHMFL